VKIDAVEVKQIVIINSFLFRNKRGSALCYRKTVLCCCCIVSRALPFARISQRFWRPWSERSHEWIAVGTQEWYRFHNRKTKVTKLCFRRWRCSNLTHTHTHTYHKGTAYFILCHTHTVIPRLTKIIRSGITFVSRNTHTDGKDELLEWPDRSCLLLYVSARIHYNIRWPTPYSLAESEKKKRKKTFVSRKIR